LVASDTNDFVATKNIHSKTTQSYKKIFIEKIYKTNSYRKITKEEACILQGFPKDFDLPNSRSRWMKLIGNSVAIPVIKSLADSILKTGVFENSK
jgi:DNA (cytosine-5)-methyltransferase 1